jgi:hypothetical protein
MILNKNQKTLILKDILRTSSLVPIVIAAHEAGPANDRRSRRVQSVPRTRTVAVALKRDFFFGRRV